MKINEILEDRKADPVKLAQRTGRRYGKEKDYGYYQSNTEPGKYIPLKNFNDDLVDNMEEVRYNIYKSLGYDSKSKNIIDIRQKAYQIAGSTKNIEIHKLYATQPFVRIEDIEVLKNKIHSNKSITVTKYENRYFVTDGHHATLAAKLRGENTVQANVIDLDFLEKKFIKETTTAGSIATSVGGGNGFVNGGPGTLSRTVTKPKKKKTRKENDK